MLILHGIVLRVRPAKSAEAYQRVWTEDGSPLMTGSVELTEQIKSKLDEQVPGKTVVKLAMRYGSPSIQQTLQDMQAQQVERLMVVPLYPQYSGATSGTVADSVFKELSSWRWVPELRLLGAYHDDPTFIHSIAQTVREHWQNNGRGDKLFISFHGMPRGTLDAGDPYFCHCHKTARLIAHELELEESQWEMAFQSRFGKAEWLKPYVAERLTQLPAEGVHNLTVICPGFSIDCLETLDEIAVEGKESFLQAGGKRFEYIPALNANPLHVSYLTERIIAQAGGWPELQPPGDLEKHQQALKLSKKLATSAGGK
jgi:ferrochelatase